MIALKGLFLVLICSLDLSLTWEIWTITHGEMRPISQIQKEMSIQ